MILQYITNRTEKNNPCSYSEFRRTYIATSAPQLRPESNFSFCDMLFYQNPGSPDMDEFYLGYENVLSDYVLSNRCLRSLNVNLILDGSGWFNNIPFRKGMCFYARPYQLHTIRANPIDPFSGVWFSISGARATHVCSILDSMANEQIISFSDTESIRRYATFFLYDFYPQFFSEPLIYNMARMLISILQSEFHESSRLKKYPSQNHDDMIAQSIIMIENNLNNITVKQLAQKTNYETKYFSKIFAEIMGLSPKEYILYKKMEQAKTLLLNTDYSIDDICNLIGYTHRNSFANIFKVKFGLSPSEYRKNNKIRS